MSQPLIVDAHEDLAYNMLCFGRDYTRPAADTRRLERESGSQTPMHNGEALLGWPDYQRGRVAIVFGTLFAPPVRLQKGEWELAYDGYEQAHRLYRSQLETYYDLADRHPDQFRLITTRADLKAVLDHWAAPGAESHPVGILPLMEGAEGVRSPSELDEWWEGGVRIIGPAWAGTRYCGGTREPGPLTDDGRALLKAMGAIGFTLDISHMDRLSALEALDQYPGPLIASHANAAALLPGYNGNRLVQDEVIKGLLARDGTIGVVPYCAFLKTGWLVGDPQQGITLETLAAHIDHICQMAGDALHVGVGSDFEGGFGLNAVPTDVDTVADLQKIGPILTAKGYNEEDVAAILGRNWLRHLESHLPS